MDKSEFGNWLMTKKPNAIVGQANSMEFCPLSCFLNETKGGFHQVQATVYIKRRKSTRTRRGMIKTKGHWVEMPMWAQAFVKTVDENHAHMDDNCKVNRIEALAILKAQP